MEDKSLLAIIAVLLLGILTVMIIQLNAQTHQEQVTDNVGNAIDHVSNQMTENLRAE